MTGINHPETSIRDARPDDVADAVGCIVRAFRTEPLMQAFFPGQPAARDASVARFSELLMRARLAIGAPCIVAIKAGRIGGIAMGYAPNPAAWPDDIQAEWDSFLASTHGLADRFDDYDRATAPFGNPRPHHYLGVLAADPDLQGQGLGARLVGTFCALADRDPASVGLALDTSNPGNLDWYGRFGFTAMGSGPVGPATVWSLFRPHGR